MSIQITRRRIFIGIPLALVAAVAGTTAWMMRPPPDDLDLSLSRRTDQGLYLATIAPEGAQPTIGPLHAWTIDLKTATGAPVADATISIDGGMLQHGHGLPTAPRITAAPAPGHYRIDGVRFNMSGWWVLTLAIEGPQGPDAITFNLVL
jgi:hypothetical protein